MRLHFPVISRMRDRTVLAESAMLRTLGVAAILAGLWLAVAWAVGVP